MTPCRLVGYQRFAETYCLHLQGLKMDTVCLSETLVACLPTSLHGVVTQKNIVILTALRTSNLTLDSVVSKPLSIVNLLHVFVTCHFTCFAHQVTMFYQLPTSPKHFAQPPCCYFSIFAEISLIKVARFSDTYYHSSLRLMTHIFSTLQLLSSRNRHVGIDDDSWKVMRHGEFLWNNVHTEFQDVWAISVHKISL
jgi:hypothetical protein